jgi:hypothetical protein
LGDNNANAFVILAGRDFVRLQFYVQQHVVLNLTALAALLRGNFVNPGFSRDRQQG